MTDLTIDTGVGWVRLRLLPRSDRAVARVSVRCDPHNYGPLFNNGPDLRAFGDAVRDWCHATAGELFEPPAPVDDQPSLFEVPQ
jgi:hypothetical protein